VSAETEHNRSFRTHAGYLTAFATLADGGRWRSPAQFLNKLAGRALDSYSNAIKPIQGSADRSLARNCLYRAWGTEALLCSTSALSVDADLVRIGLAWGAVQTYYACYGAAQAVLVAEGKGRSESHDATQRQVVQLWAERSFSLEPWSLAATEPGARGACSTGFLNGPGRPLDLTLHTWAALGPGQEWDRAGKALRTTRGEKVKAVLASAREAKRKEKLQEWKREESDRQAAGRKPREKPRFPLPQLTPTEKTYQQSRVRPVTMLDYLYRLRIKANYIDDDLFSQGPEDDETAVAFASKMEKIVAGTLLVHELRLCKLLGPVWVRNTADHWLSCHRTSESRYGLARRRTILAGI
jgi:hypothetical protein